MSENINFIPAKDLPVAEGDEVSVLCLEGNELKQKPKADLIIKLVSPLIMGIATSDNTTVTIESGSLDAVAEVLQGGKCPVVKVKHFAATSPDIPIIEGGVYDCAVLHYCEYIHFDFVIPGPGANMVRISMAPDDPEYLKVWRYPVDVPRIQVK